MIADIVIIGGGVAGTLIAERLKNINPTQKILLVNRERTLGGRIMTHEGEFGHKVELGAMRIPDTNKRTLALCQRLDLEIQSFSGGFHKCNSFIEKGSKIINPEVTYKSLFNDSIKSFCGINAEQNVSSEWLQIKMGMKLTERRLNINSMSFREWIEVIVEPEKQKLLWDLLGYDYLKSEEVDALTCLKQASSNDEYNIKYFKVKEGMQSIVKKLEIKFKKTGGSVLNGQRVTKIEKIKEKIIISTDQNWRIQCNDLILAIPPLAIKELEKKNSFLNKEQLQAIDMIGAYSSSKTYILIPNLKGISNKQKEAGFFRTNLSIRQGHWSPCNTEKCETIATMILGEYCNNSDNYTKNASNRNERIEPCKRIINDIRRIIKNPIEKPLEIIRHEWRECQSGIAAHYWKKGSSPRAVLEKIEKNSEHILLAGEAYSEYHGWIEGAISSSEKIVKILTNRQ